MTYSDSKGHRWPDGLLPDDRCFGCGTEYDSDAAEEECPRTIAEPAPAEFDKAWCEFEAWARATFEADLARCREKALEYGSADLEIMGQAMQSLIPRSDLSMEDRRSAGLEMAIAFYWMGKASRLFGAWNKGTSPGNDSWRDGTIYSMMARYVRESGRWLG